uniref:S1 motif domain-containing protein n=1 Tax=Caenorhabditis japonica TaxID=281687 RepID=A0A8R1IY70_CAEJA
MTSKPALKPPPPMLKKVRAMRDLAVGQRYSGVVRNKTDFGLFVDIGVERDGLVHISQFRKTGAEEPPTVGELLEVVVANLSNNKIALNLAG